MPSHFSFIDIIFILLLGVFIFTRFFSSKLPKDDKTKKRPTAHDVFISDLEAAGSTPHALRPVPQALPDLTGLTGVELVRQADARFDEKAFLVGAQEAYHMFYDARRKADHDLLRQLLSPKLEKKFLQEADENKTQGRQLDIRVEKIEKAEIAGVQIKGKTAVIDVAYTSRIKNPHPQAEGKPAPASPQARTVREVFTWARNIDAEDVNWELVDIKAMN